jgi:hypothetical protein
MKTVFFRYSIFIFLVGLFNSTGSIAQEIDASNYKMMFSFNTIKQTDNSRLLEVRFYGRNKEDRKDNVPVFDAEIKFLNILNDEEVLLGAAKTSNEGFAQLILPKDQSYLANEDGFINLTARFEGSDGLDEEEDEILIKDLHLELNLSEIDSVKTVSVKAYTINSLGDEVPVDEADINFYIGGMLSKMKINEETISDGEFEFEFESDLPGDKDQNITIYAMIEDNDDFGNVNQQQTIKWGASHIHIYDAKNTLWSKAAPIWMYIVLTVLLVGVWANYIYTIINLVRIKKEGDNMGPRLRT